MKTNATFYHAGCPVCVAAENTIAESLDSSRFDVEIVHLGEAKDRLVEAENGWCYLGASTCDKRSAFFISIMVPIYLPFNRQGN